MLPKDAPEPQTQTQNVFPTLRNHAAAMEDSAMMDASQPIFEELHFITIPNAITEERQQQVLRRVSHASGHL
jgi:hypothetical protein